jgi:hypothetical protein
MWFLVGFLIGAYTLGAIIWNTRIRRKFYYYVAKSIQWFMKTTDKILSKFDAGEK